MQGINRTVISLLLCLLSLPLVGKEHQILVMTETAQWSEISEEVPITGTVISPRIALLSTEVEGLVESIRVEAGDRVEQGDEILRLKSDLEQLSLKAAQAETEEAKQALVDARRRLTDAKALAKHKTISSNDVSLLRAEVNMKKATLQKLSAREKRQALRVRMHTLSAPFKGVIKQREIEQGEWLSPGQATVELVATDNLEIDFPVPESVYPKLSHPLSLSVRFNMGSHQSYPAQIARIIPITDQNSRMFSIRAVLDQSGDISSQEHVPALIPGLSTSGVLKIQTAEKGIVINRNAIQRYPDGRITIWVVKEQNENHQVTEKQVKTGLSFNGKIQIISGVQPGDRIVTQGNELLREGQTVRIKNQ